MTDENLTGHILECDSTTEQSIKSAERNKEKHQPRLAPKPVIDRNDRFIDMDITEID